jgi:hypothetical protein
MIYLNKIPFKKRIIVHENEAINLVSFHFENPEDTTDWLKIGNKPIMFCEKTWDDISQLKFKIIQCDKGTVESIEIPDQ